MRVPSDPDYFYVMQSDGNIVSYNSKTGKAVWSSSTKNNLGLGTPGGYSIVFQDDGNLVIYDIEQVAIWVSVTYIGSFPTRWTFYHGMMTLEDDSRETLFNTYGPYPIFGYAAIV